MRLFEAIVDANHRAHAGDAEAGVRPHEFPESLPVVALTCFDPRLHPLMPEVLGIAEADFLWLTNAGNTVTGPLSSTARSVALACAVHEGREIAIIGHTDCRFFQPGRFFLDQQLRDRGIHLGAGLRHLDEFLRPLVNEENHVRLSVRFLRTSPLIPATVPVHGLLVDIESGRLDWVVNGYETLPSTDLGQVPLPPAPELGQPDFRIGDNLPPIGG